jgi:hypothetical protein
MVNIILNSLVSYLIIIAIFVVVFLPCWNINEIKADIKKVYKLVVDFLGK